MDGVDNGISGGNDREDRIAKFLKEAPAKAVTVLLVGDDGGKATQEVLASWEKSLWSEQLATLINCEMENQHELVDGVDSYYWLIFVGENPSDVMATRRRRFNVRTRKALIGTGDDGLPKLQLDGSNATAATLNQTILFKMVALYSSNMQGLLNSQDRVIGKLTDLFEASKNNEKAARDDLHELKELIVELRASESENDNGEMTEAQKAWFELAQKATSSAELQRLVDGVSKFLLAKFGT